MPWWVWLLVVLVVLMALGGGFDASSTSSRRKVGAGRARRDPDERTADVINESLAIAKRTKNRATAQRRLAVAEELVEELAKSGSTAIDTRTARKRVAAVRAMVEQRSPP